MNQVATIPNKSTSVLVRLGVRFGVDPDKMLGTLKATAFKGEASTEQLMALCIVAEQYNLNPWTKEIYAFPSRGGIVPIVGLDGWARIINENPNFDGVDFIDGPLDESKIPEWIECRMHRKDRSHPVSVREYFSEVNRNTDPWKSHPRRMLRHKAMIQAARLAFGYTGIYDEDEGERVRQAIDVTPTRVDPRGEDGIKTLEDFTLRDKHFDAIKATIDELGADEEKLGAALRDYVETSGLNSMQELYIAVLDRMVAESVITRAYWRKLLKS